MCHLATQAQVLPYVHRVVTSSELSNSFLWENVFCLHWGGGEETTLVTYGVSYWLS